jgi:membrane-bound serine protease (ClpP class)
MDETILLEPNLLYLVLIVSAWIGVLALFVPGTGIIELLAGAGLLYGIGGLAYAGANVLSLLMVAASFVMFALVILRQFTDASNKRTLDLPVPPIGLAIAAALVQVGGGLIMTSDLPEISPWVAFALALSSLAVYRWMLLPTVNALRPPPQAGVEALLGSVAEVRTAPSAPGKPGMVYLNGELWQAVSEEDLVTGDLVDVVAREGMRLHVQKHVGTGR